MYSYVLNNPLSKTDPTGMNACGTSNKDSRCTVTVTLQDRNKVNGHYSDQFSNLKGNLLDVAPAQVTNLVAFSPTIRVRKVGDKLVVEAENGTWSVADPDEHPSVRILSTWTDAQVPAPCR